MTWNRNYCSPIPVFERLEWTNGQRHNWHISLTVTSVYTVTTTPSFPCGLHPWTQFPNFHSSEDTYLSDRRGLVPTLRPAKMWFGGAKKKEEKKEEEQIDTTSYEMTLELYQRKQRVRSEKAGEAVGRCRQRLSRPTEGWLPDGREPTPPSLRTCDDARAFGPASDQRRGACGASPALKRASGAAPHFARA